MSGIPNRVATLALRRHRIFTLADKGEDREDWLFIRREDEDASKYRYCLSNGDADTSLQQLVY